MKYYYDLHIHSDLSPCGSKDMTPNNIVNMSCIKRLNVLSVTDHNTVRNYPAVKKVALKKNIEVIPGMEVSSREEVHLLCFFREYLDALKVDNIIYESLPNINNNATIFGEQNIYNEKDEIVGQIEKLLLNSSKYSIDEIFNIVKKNNGIVIPAHVNRQAYGMVGVLGFIPNNLDINYIEIADKHFINDKIYKNYKIIQNSDAHRLADISEPINYINADSSSDFMNKLGL